MKDFVDLNSLLFLARGQFRPPMKVLKPGMSADDKR